MDTKDVAQSLSKPVPPTLGLRAEFEAVIDSYQPSSHARQVASDVTLAVMSGPTAAGRNTIIWSLLKTGKYYFIVSDTTRPKRTNDGVPEQNGKEYWFRTEQEVLDDLKAGEFLEAELIHNQQVSGISIRELERARNEHKIAITDVDIQGIDNALNAKSDAIALLVFPPDFDTWQQRLSKRGSMDVTELRKRVGTAADIFALPEQSDRYKIVINDTIEHAVEQVRAIAEKGSVDATFQERAREIARGLKVQTQTYLRRLSQ